MEIITLQLESIQMVNTVAHTVMSVRAQYLKYQINVKNYGVITSTSFNLIWGDAKAL